MLSDISKEREKYLRDDELISINKKDIMENNTTENIQKRVSFETTNYDFISKLKKIDKNNSNYKIEEDSTNNMLNKILSNQEMIIQLLNNIVRKE